MEQEEIIYDLESPGQEDAGGGPEESCLSPEPDCPAEDPGAGIPEEDSLTAGTGADMREDAGDKEDKGKVERSEAEKEIGRMLEEVGAETLLSIIKDNRNAAIRQIISEVSAAQDRSLPSGSSSMRACASIFDLAAMA